MQKVTLQFKSAAQLWAFKQTIKAHSVEVNLTRCTLICDCSEMEVALATEKYNARIIQNESDSGNKAE